MSKYVFSTLSSPVEYASHKPGGDGLPILERTVRIEGGAGVANKNFITPRGVVTVIADEDVALLEANEIFRMHRGNGFVKIEDKNADPENVAADMTGRDQGSPIVPQDYDGTGQLAPTSKKGK